MFTIGASTAAMYRVTLNLVRGEGGGVVRSFWASFKLNFKQGVLLFLILLIPTLLVIVEVEIYLSGAVAQSVWMGVISASRRCSFRCIITSSNASSLLE